MEHRPNEIGLRAELEVARACTRAGMGVFIPLFDAHGRVDLVIERDRELFRVQCKSATMRSDDVVFFRTCSNTANTPRSYADEVDVFGVYSPHIDKVFLVPMQGLGERGCHLRLGPTLNGQQRGIRWAADYELPPRRSDGEAEPIPGG